MLSSAITIHRATSAIRIHAPVAQPLFTLVQRGKPLGVVSGPSRAAVSSSARRPRPRDAERPPQGLPPRGGGGDGLGGALSWHDGGRAFTSTGAIFLDLDGGGGDEGGGGGARGGDEGGEGGSGGAGEATCAAARVARERGGLFVTRFTTLLPPTRTHPMSQQHTYYVSVCVRNSTANTLQPSHFTPAHLAPTPPADLPFQLPT